MQTDITVLTVALQQIQFFIFILSLYFIMLLTLEKIVVNHFYYNFISLKFHIKLLNICLRDFNCSYGGFSFYLITYYYRNIAFLIFYIIYLPTSQLN